MSNLVDLDNDNLEKVFEKEKTFPLIINLALQYLQNETVIKIIEVSMDFIEFLLTQLPEPLFNQIENIIRALL